MNILYISPMKVDREHLDGVARKILSQCQAFKSYGNNVYLASYFENGKYYITGDNYEHEICFSPKSSKQLELFEIYPQMVNVCDELKIDAVYFRIFALSWVSDALFNKLHKKGIKIAVEIPTYPFWKEKWMDVKDKLLSGAISTAIKRTITNIVYYVFAHRLKKWVAAIVTFSDIKRLWGIPVIGIANGYTFMEPDYIKKFKDPAKSLNLLMVASIRDNHGADRVIDGISKYYKENAIRDVSFHIVGDGEIVPLLKKRVKELGNIEDKVIFHGFKAGVDLEKMYDMADIGVSALAFHRLGVFYASPLKSKEYFAKGIPVLGSTVEHDVINSDCKKYYFSIPEDDSSVDIEKLCQFFDDLYMQGCTNVEIIHCAKQCFDWNSIMHPICEVFKD